MNRLAPEVLVDTYLAALEAGDVERVLSVFTPDGVVESPLYGRQSAREFYPALFADTSASVLTLKKILTSVDSSTLAFWFDFGWTLADGTPAPFTVVDLAELAEDGRIERLHIVYDTHPLRDLWAARTRSR